jgi:hypothetical protein
VQDVTNAEFAKLQNGGSGLQTIKATDGTTLLYVIAFPLKSKPSKPHQTI